MKIGVKKYALSVDLKGLVKDGVRGVNNHGKTINY
jgi:hypothetical protein